MCFQLLFRLCLSAFCLSACISIKDVNAAFSEISAYNLNIKQLKSFFGTIRRIEQFEKDLSDAAFIINVTKLDPTGITMLHIQNAIKKAYRIRLSCGDTILVTVVFDQKSMKQIHYAFLFKKVREWVSCIDGNDHHVKYNTFKFSGELEGGVQTLKDKTD